MKRYPADLHIHSALSPCAGEEMTPPAIVQKAVECGLAMIAICDHNAAGNVAATQEAARKATGLTVLAGIEVTTAEEVHVVGLFGNLAAATTTAEVVQATLPETDAESRRRFGEQRLMDAVGRVVGQERKMLAAASALTLSEAIRLIREHRGLAVAAHVNRRTFSVISQLGVFPTEAGFDAIEVFRPCGPRQGLPDAERPERFETYGLPVLWSSDAHFLADIGRARSEARMQEPTFDELVLALRGIGGRSVGGA